MVFCPNDMLKALTVKAFFVYWKELGVNGFFKRLINGFKLV